MELLETPAVEALAFRYSAAAAGSLWPWIAVLSAAFFGLWRIRAIGYKSDAPPPATAGPALAGNPGPPSDPAPPADRPLSWHVDGGSTPKRRFTAYFDTDHEWSSGGEEKGSGGGAVEELVVPPAGKRWGLEGMRIRMRGDLGWYRYQDLTALNGSVVKLWDGA